MDMEFTKFVEEQRGKGLSDRKIAMKIGCSAAHLCYIMRGERKPSEKVLKTVRAIKLGYIDDTMKRDINALNPLNVARDHISKAMELVIDENQLSRLSNLYWVMTEEIQAIITRHATYHRNGLVPSKPAKKNIRDERLAIAELTK